MKLFLIRLKLETCINTKKYKKTVEDNEDTLEFKLICCNNDNIDNQSIMNGQNFKIQTI